MNMRELQRHLNSLCLNYYQLSKAAHIETASLLIRAADICLEQLRNDLHESDAATNRRKAKGRETKVDPKPPVSPVRVAAASKPKKPKYSGNHAPSTRG
jgi:hypothetical protein